MTARMTVDRVSYRAPEVAQMLGVSKASVYDWVESGLLPHVKVNRTVLIRAEDLEAFLARHTRRKGA